MAHAAMNALFGVTQLSMLLLSPAMLTSGPPHDSIVCGWSLGCVAAQIVAIQLCTAIAPFVLSACLRPGQDVLSAERSSSGVILGGCKKLDLCEEVPNVRSVFSRLEKSSTVQLKSYLVC